MRKLNVMDGGGGGGVSISKKAQGGRYCIGNFNMKLNGRWSPQIVDRDSGNQYPIYPPFPCSDF